MKRVVILTGSELRHDFMRKAIAGAGVCEVTASYCEGLAQSLSARLERQDVDDGLQRRHVEDRAASERDFFEPFVRLTDDRSAPVAIAKGAVNDAEVVQAIIGAAPDLLVAYGCSLIDQPLTDAFAGRFLNVHLGLSPYYRGSGTNFFPLVHGTPEYVGATFMHLDSGIDTGEIIHQIRARVRPGDTPHQIGNRLIADVAAVYCAVVDRFDDLAAMRPPPTPAEERLCLRKDFTPEATAALYQQFADGMVERYLAEQEARDAAVPIVTNPILKDVLS